MVRAIPGEDVMAKRAFLIGINRYQIAGADLRGCVNDVKDLSAALDEFHGFKKSDITVLTDGAATKKAMQAGIKRLVRDSKKGRRRVLHYSGHGSNVPDDNGDEADGRDEILCPTDLDWDDPLRDDWLRTTFDGLRAGVNFTVIMDCCHSGTNTRAILPPDAPVKERYLPSPWGLKAVESGRSRREEGHERAAPFAARRAQGQGHRQGRAARGAHHRLPRHADVGGRLHQQPVQRRADVLARRGDSQEQGQAHVPRAARSRARRRSRRGSSIRCRSSKAGTPIRPAAVFGVRELHVDDPINRSPFSASTATACFAFRAPPRSRSS